MCKNYTVSDYNYSSDKAAIQPEISLVQPVSDSILKTRFQILQKVYSKSDI